ncbi:hypothetical protein D9M68_332170 [compost metagenome]
MLLRRRGVLLDRRAGHLGDRLRLGLRLGGHLRLRQDHGHRTALGRPPLMGIDALDLDPGGAGLGITELLRRGEGEVDDAVGIERATVVDPQDHAAAVVQVGHPDIARQRQGLVRGGHAVEVVGLAVGSGLAMELGAIPGRRAGRLVATRIVHRVVGLAKHGIGIGLDRAVVRHGHGVGNARDIDVPPGSAVLVRARIIAGAGDRPAGLNRLRRAAARAAGQQQCYGAVDGDSYR